LRDFDLVMLELVLNCPARLFSHYTAASQIAAIPAKQSRGTILKHDDLPGAHSQTVSARFLQLAWSLSLQDLGLEGQIPPRRLLLNRPVKLRQFDPLTLGWGQRMALALAKFSGRGLMVISRDRLS
jgi:hypothetical protein